MKGELTNRSDRGSCVLEIVDSLNGTQLKDHVSFTLPNTSALPDPFGLMEMPALKVEFGRYPQVTSKIVALTGERPDELFDISELMVS